MLTLCGSSTSWIAFFSSGSSCSSQARVAIWPPHSAGASSQTAFGARGSATFMQKLTTGLAVTFMLLSIVLVMLTNRKQKQPHGEESPRGGRSEKSAPAAPKPAEKAPAPAPAPRARLPRRAPPLLRRRIALNDHPCRSGGIGRHAILRG